MVSTLITLVAMQLAKTNQWKQTKKKKNDNKKQLHWHNSASVLMLIDSMSLHTHISRVGRRSAHRTWVRFMTPTWLDSICAGSSLSLGHSHGQNSLKSISHNSLFSWQWCITSSHTVFKGKQTKRWRRSHKAQVSVCIICTLSHYCFIFFSSSFQFFFL